MHPIMLLSSSPWDLSPEAWPHKNKRQLGKLHCPTDTGQWGSGVVGLRLILNYGSLFAFIALHLQLKRFSASPSLAFSGQKFITPLKDIAIGFGLCKTCQQP